MATREEVREAGVLGQENGTATAWEEHRRKETDMDRMVTRAAPYLYAVLRIIGALLYACHGAQKLLGLFGGVRGGTVPLLSLMGLAGVMELGAGLLIAGGVLTRPAAFLASGEMAFAYWLSHAPRGFWPIRNGGELAVLNCFLFLYIASQGAGPWSLAQLGKTLHRAVPLRTVRPSPSG
jgi:putative oxidoreductase